MVVAVLDICLDGESMRGFSLIEVLVVLLVVAVLAAVAAPGYLEWQARAENAAALSDLTQLIRAEAVFFGDWQQFGRSHDLAAAAAHGAGVALVGPGTPNAVIACPGGFMALPISRGVSLMVSTDPAFGRTFSGIAKHLQGTRFLGMDSDVGVLRQRGGVRGVSLADSGVVVDASGGDDVPAAAGWQNL